MNPPPSKTPVTLQEVFRGIEVAGFSGDWKTAVTSLRTDSRRVVPGSIFFAIPGGRVAGAQFIGEAIARGAAAIVAESGAGGGHANLAWVSVGNVRKALAMAARNFYHHPEEKLHVAGVTGTNGKTTVTTLLRYLLGSGGERWGLIGTIRYELGVRDVPAHRTTPEAPDLCDMMAQMVAAGCTGLAMEVSSHAIDQRRVDGLPFSVLAFTNLSRDHIDYHGDMETYFQAKARAFLGTDGTPPPSVAVLNADDASGRRLAGMLSPESRKITFGESAEAEVRAESVRLQAGGSTFTVVWPEGQGEVRTTLPGHYNVSNILCALAMARGLGRDIGELLPVVANFPGVSGRMERVAPALPYQVFVDYAHTDDALKNALEMLRAITPGRLLVVFGCGGNRDRGKRPEMTRVVQQLADHAWATSDNPRKEPQEAIFADMRAGVTAPEKIEFIEDRRHAISLALDAARAGDSLLVAGKGHETWQEFADVTVPFDDRVVVRELLELKQLRPGV